MKDTELFNQLGLTVLTSARVSVSRDWAGGGKNVHSDPFSRLFYLNSGSGELLMESGPCPMEEGHLYLIPAFTPCRYVCNKDIDLCFIHFIADFPGQISLFDLYSLPHSLNIADFLPGADLINAVSHREGDEADCLKRDGALRLVLSEFLRRGRKKDSFHSQMHRFEEVFAYINEHLTETIRLKELAALVSLHPTYFSNLFTKTVGDSPINYIQRKRVDRAALRLAFTEDTLEVIARETGFSDAFHLSRVFKSFTGYAPGQFRSRMI